jgi:hypothetical protein
VVNDEEMMHLKVHTSVSDGLVPQLAEAAGTPVEEAKSALKLRVLESCPGIFIELDGVPDSGKVIVRVKVDTVM